MTDRDQHHASPPERLVCGRPIDDVIEQVAAGRAHVRDAHQEGCVHCQAALAEYQQQWAPLAALAAEPVTAPPGKIDKLLQRLRSTLARPEYAIIPDPDGELRIAARVITVTAREAAAQVDGVRVALTDTGVTAGVAGGTTAIEITLAAGFGYDLHELADRVRAAVATAVRDITGLTAAEITVVIDDVLE
ncbi:Uncharacterized conserved protein YloU, alkaline shock protein (Asp23) family [Pseudonocardia thermophila]|jgi:Uncharacterized protein conserved in bacteria|uniref:Uncharacterized conserved protein YloU, alkaline shock protein (Asp23) family n=1 Tax=Pseudonocardia thermophila TaxID=1848 RepID=A0A1M6PG29_PSETH|nr:Asp23/Gls24 family envelope stress response protein [Pseudonocardia thermophila]SHK06906.1 Uncharacterized conserved protein YloU, alkaline shock protein (Asp23) family [Pseudonocardia thermophila]